MAKEWFQVETSFKFDGTDPQEDNQALRSTEGWLRPQEVLLSLQVLFRFT
jgi:hypothetical protein